MWSIRPSQPSFWAIGLLLVLHAALLALVLSGRIDGVIEKRPSDARWRLIEKGPFQYLYGPDKRLERMLHDANGDARAETIIFYGQGGSPTRAEIDNDRDGVIDRWEHYRSDGRSLEKVGRARRTPGVPDEWLYPGPDGSVARAERDEDGDGRIDEVEHLEAGQLVYRELDTDRDGTIDRWTRFRDGALVSDEQDAKR